MTQATGILTLSAVSLEYFLGLLPEDRITREKDRIVVHAEAGDAIWFARGNRWITAAPGFEAAARSGARGTRH